MVRQFVSVGDSVTVIILVAVTDSIAITVRGGRTCAYKIFLTVS